MKTLLVRVGLGILGLVAVLAWWTIHPGASHTQPVRKIPAAVWGGGPTKITVETESSTPMKMGFTFSDHSKPAGEQPILDADEKAVAGSHSWSVTVPDKVGGYIELGAEHPKAGDWLKWKVSFNGVVVKEEKEVLEKDLGGNEAFFLQLYYDDFSKAVQEKEEHSADPVPSSEED